MTGRQHLQQAGATNSGLHMNTNDNSISSDTSESDGTYSTILYAISWILDYKFIISNNEISNTLIFF